MTKIKSSALMLSGTILLAYGLLFAQVQRPGEYPRGVKPSPMMNFFVTSEPVGDGGNLGGLAGADASARNGRRRRKSHLARLFEHAGAARPGRRERARPHRQRPLVSGFSRGFVERNLLIACPYQQLNRGLKPPPLQGLGEGKERNQLLVWVTVTGSSGNPDWSKKRGGKMP